MLQSCWRIIVVKRDLHVALLCWIGYRAVDTSWPLPVLAFVLTCWSGGAILSSTSIWPLHLHH